MSAKCFLDTNVFVNAAAGKGFKESKCKRALKLIESQDFGISAQVLQEFYGTVVRKIQEPLTPEMVIEWIEQMAVFPCLALDISFVKMAMQTSVRYKLAFWDAAIVAAAEVMGSGILYSEDLNHGQQYGSVRVWNPFRLSGWNP